jgi:hypothetical protein
MNHVQHLRAARMCKSAWTMGGVANTVTDYLPFVGAAKDIGRGVRDLSQGNVWSGLGQMAMGAGMGVLDATTMGVGSALARGGIKGLTRGVAMTAAKRALPYTAVSAGMGEGMKALAGTGATPAAEQPAPPNTPMPGWQPGLAPMPNNGQPLGVYPRGAQPDYQRMFGTGGIGMQYQPQPQPAYQSMFSTGGIGMPYQPHPYGAGFVVPRPYVQPWNR